LPKHWIAALHSQRSDPEVYHNLAARRRFQVKPAIRIQKPEIRIQKWHE
jgi:hypothetical protein